MFNVNFYIKKNDDVPNEEFRSYWLGEHADLQKKYAEKLGVRAYIKNEPLPDHPVGVTAMDAYQTGPIRYDFIDTWQFNDIKALKDGAADPEVQTLMAQAHDSEKAYVDVAQSNVLMSVDLAQFFPPDAMEVRATPESGFVKIFYTVRVFDHLSREQAQLHWNACHGAVSRQDIKYSVQKKYIQCHAIDSTFVDLLVAERGYEVDPTFIGHAEGWIEVDQPAKDYPQDVLDEVVAMSMDDIDLFSNKARGNVFVSHEHYIIDKPVIVRPHAQLFFGRLLILTMVQESKTAIYLR